MGIIPLLATCFIFGGVCVRYVTVIGFSISAVATVLVLAFLSWLTGASYSLWTLAGCLLALEAGYFCFTAASAFWRPK